MIRRLKKLGRLLLSGAGRKPRPYETSVLYATVQALPEPDSRLLKEQAAAIERFQRLNDDRMVILGFEDKNALGPLQRRDTDYCLSRVKLRGGSTTLVGRVMTHRGILSSLEFRPSPRQLGGHEYSVEVIDVYGGGQGVSETIDLEEHYEPG